MPGSLGVEAILQGMQAFALHFDLGKGLVSPRFRMLDGALMDWHYRGQILPENKLMQLEVHFSRLERLQDEIILEGDGRVWADDLCIYQAQGAAMRLIPA